MASRAEWIEAVARALLEAVEAMRVPQTIFDAALQVATFSPLVSSLRALAGRGA